MKPRRPTLTAVCLASLLLLGPVGGRSVGAVDLVSVDIVDEPRPQARWGYAPRSRHVEPETWVTWSNSGQDVHTVTAVDDAFDSGELAPSEGFSWYFDQPGTFRYVCALHPWMTGQIVVGDDSAG